MIDFSDNVDSIQLLDLLFVLVTFRSPPLQAFHQECSGILAKLYCEGVDLIEIKFLRTGCGLAGGHRGI
jgi:hypothetical protein